MYHFKNLNKTNKYKNVLAKNARFFEYYVFILAIKLGNNLI